MTTHTKKKTKRNRRSAHKWWTTTRALWVLWWYSAKSPGTWLKLSFRNITAKNYILPIVSLLTVKYRNFWTRILRYIYIHATSKRRILNPIFFLLFFFLYETWTESLVFLEEAKCRSDFWFDFVFVRSSNILSFLCFSISCKKERKKKTFLTRKYQRIKQNNH